jgi:hypothetical protein
MWGLFFRIAGRSFGYRGKSFVVVIPKPRRRLPVHVESHRRDEGIQTSKRFMNVREGNRESVMLTEGLALGIIIWILRVLREFYVTSVILFTVKGETDYRRICNT